MLPKAQAVDAALGHLFTSEPFSPAAAILDKGLGKGKSKKFTF